MTALAIIADDLTGAMDTAAPVAARGYETVVVAVPDGSAKEAAVVAFNTDSRYLPTEDATVAVRRAISALEASVVYKKVDSTLRGNVSAEVATAVEATGADLAAVAPAFPATGRQTWDGIHRVGERPVAETEFGRDENGPSTSVLTDLFAGEGHPVEHVAGTLVERGPASVERSFRAAIDHHDRPPIVVCDARNESHLATIARAGVSLDALFVGSGGLAGTLELDAAAMATDEPPEPPRGEPLAVVGSVSETTLEQLAAVPEAWLVRVDPLRLLAEPRAVAGEVAARLNRDRPVVLTAATDRSTVEQTVAAGTERGLSAAAIREQIATGLAAVGADACRARLPSGLFLAGGDIAVATLESLEATAVSLTGERVDAGVPLGRLVDGVAAECSVITKAGGFGEESTIINCLDALQST